MVLALSLSALSSGTPALASCSGISGGKGGYISGGDCGSTPSPPSYSSGGSRPSFRSSGGNAFGGVSPGSVGAATGAAAAILNGLGGGDAPPQSPSHDDAACERTQREEGVASSNLVVGIMSAGFASRTESCQAHRKLLDLYDDRLAKQETLVFSCDMHITRNSDGFRIDSSNFYTYRGQTVGDAQKQVDEACHQSTKFWAGCEDYLRSKAYDDAKTCFIELRELAVLEDNQRAVDRADVIADWLVKHDQEEAKRAKDQAKIAAMQGCENTLAAKNLGGALTCFRSLLSSGTLAGDTARTDRARDVIAKLMAFQDKLAAAAEAAAAQKQFGGNDPFSSGGGSAGNPFDGNAPSGAKTTGATNVVSSPSPSPNPYDADKAGFDGPGGHLYSTTPEDGVYGTSTYRDGTTAAPAPRR